MAISDLFSSTFLFSITIILILFGAGFVYVSYKMAEQDHKLTSMVNLVSILAQDLHFVKSHIAITEPTTDNNDMLEKMMGGNQILETTASSEIISVSDDEDEDYDDDNDEDDDDDDVDDDEDDDDVDDDEDDDDVDDDEDDDEVENRQLEDGQLEDGQLEDGQLKDEQLKDEDKDVSQKQIKLINLTLENDIVEDISCHFEDINSQQEEIKTIHLETPINSEETKNQLQIPLESNVKISSEDISFLKNVAITDLGDTDELHDSKSEYKKMSLNKLREVVISKGIVTDSSKLKKNDILKILGEE